MALSIRMEPPVSVMLEGGQLVTIDGLKEQWKSIPYAAHSKKVAEEAKKTLALFNDPLQSKPSKLAGLSFDKVKNCRTIILIDNMFITALEEYKSSLIDATAKDFDIFMQPRCTALDFHYAIATGAARFAAKTPDVPVIKQLIGPLMACIGAIYGWANQEELVNEKKAEENSVNRTKCFQEMMVKEKVRIQKAVTLINLRVNTIKKDVEDAGDLVDTRLTDELKLLNQFTTFISPGTQLKVNGMLVLDYLKDIEED